ncbi:hypothetical protein PAEPH01_1306 [Pancytospora epiphaga]|nr:hypothetical protein PAEPH01_1306 [Pancytospora epiphaga]
MARKQHNRSTERVSKSPEHYGWEMDPSESISTRNVSLPKISNDSTALLSRENLEPEYDCTEDSDSVKIVYSQENKNREFDETLYGEGIVQHDFEDRYSEHSLESLNDSDCSCDYSSHSKYLFSMSEDYEENIPSSFSEYNETTEGSTDNTTILDDDKVEEYRNTSTESYSNENNERSSSVILIRNEVPEEHDSSESDVRIISSVIQNDPVNNHILVSFFNNDINDYNRVLGIEDMPHRCRLKLIHAMTARLWSNMLEPETFPSLEDFRTLSLGLRMVERATEWDLLDSALSVQNTTEHAAESLQDDLFPLQPPVISQYRGPVRFDLIETLCIGPLLDRIEWVMEFGTHREATAFILLLANIASFFTREEIEYITNEVYDVLGSEGSKDASVAHIILFVYDWVHQSNTWREYSKKKYNVISYNQLLDVRDTFCQICYEDYKNWSKVSTMDCLHCFHSRCLKLWLRESPRCPLCRSLPTMPNSPG